jgi:probable phosphoglycerate mutase
VELILIRHGLPLRVERSDGAPADPSLGEEGREQARRMASWLAALPIDALYASPLRRAVETAEPLAKTKDLEIRIEPGVRELDADSARYVPLEELKREDYSAWRAMMAGGLYAEIDLPAFRREVIRSLEGIARAHRGQRVAVVCHGGVINTWASHLLGIEETLFFDPGYTSVNRFLVASSGERSIASLNETAHLRDDVRVEAAAKLGLAGGGRA